MLFNDDDFLNSPGRHLYTMVIPACLESVIAVGAVQHRSEYMSIDSAHHMAPLGSKDGQLASYSSCGPSFDGLIKPDVVAPGIDDEVIITVYNVNGKTEFSGRVSNGTVKLPVLDAGVYAVQLGSAGSTLIRIGNY